MGGIVPVTNPATVPPPSSFDVNFAQLLQHSAKFAGPRTAMVLRDRELSFTDIGAKAAAIAAALTDAGVRPGDRVAVLVRQPDDAAAAFFAALGVGAIGINVNELYRPRQIEYVLAHARVSVLLTSAESLRLQPRPLETDATILDVAALVRTAELFLPCHRLPDDFAQVVYTSGSTGQPKGVLVTHANLWAGARIVARYLGVRSSDRIASLLPFSFVYGFNQLVLALWAGATLVVERSTFPNDAVATLRREKVTMLAAVPPLWMQLLSVSAFRDERLADLRVMTNAGGRLPPAVVRELRRAQPQADLYLMYGLTEVFRSTYLPPSEVDEHPDSMGRAIPESTVFVVNDDGYLCGPGEVGELAHGGPTVSVGYLNDPEATARVFRPNPFLADDVRGPDRLVFSGDLVKTDEEGRLYYVGRRDRQFKTLGYRVSPDEIADVLYASGQVQEALVVPEPDEQRGQRIVACVVLKQGGSIALLRQFCGVELPRYMQPARFEALESLPRNVSGKHDVIALKAWLSEHHDART